MKFREYGDVLPRTITGLSPFDLDNRIEAFGNKYDIIDLQYAVTKGVGVEYSALILYRPKKDND
jgi:hypothetical protein